MIWLLFLSSALHASCYYGKVNKNKAGNDEGKKLCFYDEDMKKSTGFESYKDGKLHGQAVYNHPETGKVTSEKFYRDGKLEGVEKRYRSDGSGKLMEELSYKGDVQDGQQKYYYELEDHAGLRRLTIYAQGKEVGPVTEYYKSGGRSSLDYLANNLGEYRSRAEYYENGSLRSILLRLGNQFGDVARLDYAVSGRLVKMMCQPPGKSYIYKLDECQKHFRIPLAGLPKQIK